MKIVVSLVELEGGDCYFVFVAAVAVAFVVAVAVSSSSWPAAVPYSLVINHPNCNT